MVQTLSDNFLAAGDAAERLQSSSALPRSRRHNRRWLMNADQPVFCGIDNGCCDQLLLAEQPRHLLLVVMTEDAAGGSSSIRSESGTGLRERNSTSAKPPLASVAPSSTALDLVKPIRQIGVSRHVVDRLPHGPVRRHRK